MSKLSLQDQDRLLRTCVAEEIDLADALHSIGRTYDDLVYRYNAPLEPTPAKYTSPAAYDARESGIPALSFFSGCGGMEIGFKRAGFLVLGAFEINEVFCETLRANDPALFVYGPPSWGGDLRRRETVASVIETRLAVFSEFEGVFFGGPPCQPFSIAANQRFAKWGDNFKRVGFAHEDQGTLVHDFVWYICRFRPKGFVLENVPGLLTVDGGTGLTRILETLVAEGYRVTKPTVLDAAHYGVPQHRHRLFVVGWRGQGEFTWPQEDLVLLPCYKALDQPPNGDASHITRQHRAESIARYMNLEYGQRDRLGRVDRLNPNLCAKTVIAGGLHGGGRSHLHPTIPRTLSPRECARLQTFPDDYIFCGSPARQLTQIGNAVPPLLGMKIASQILSGIFGW